jgi:hypothetical protein
MSFFDTLKAKAKDELKILEADGRKIEDKVLEYFHLGALHSKLIDLEAKTADELWKLKVAAEEKLHADAARLREAFNTEAAKLRDEFKKALTTM